MDQEIAQPPPNVSATSVKIPEFWNKSPAVWFARIEAQFSSKAITQDQTKYDYVVSALDVNTADEMQHILLNPPTTMKYQALKQELITTFGKSQFERDSELLNLNGLGDRRPSALLRKINALNNDPETLKRAIFLANLPTEIRSVLAAQQFPDVEQLAAAADRIWESRAISINNINSSQAPFPMKTTEDFGHIDAVSTKSRSRRPHQPTTESGICFYHTRFGLEARRCQGNCKFSTLLSPKAPSNKSSGNA